MKRQRRGYILLEAVAALAILSVGILAIQQAMREALATRGQARDYTQARFLLEDLMGELELRTNLLPESRSGGYEGDLSRFQWKYTITRVAVPQPNLGTEFPDAGIYNFTFPAVFMGKIEATVSWTRGGRIYEAKGETLVAQEKLLDAFVPSS